MKGGVTCAMCFGCVALGVSCRPATLVSMLVMFCTILVSLWLLVAVVVVEVVGVV